MTMKVFDMHCVVPTGTFDTLRAFSDEVESGSPIGRRILKLLEDGRNIALFDDDGGASILAENGVIWLKQSNLFLDIKEQVNVPQ